MNRRSAGARPSWPGLDFSQFLEPGRLGAGSELGFCSKPPDPGLQKNRISGRAETKKIFLVGLMISKHLVPNTKEFCAVLNLSHPIGRFECCVPNTSHRLRHCPASLLGHGPARAQFMKHEETIDFVDRITNSNESKYYKNDFLIASFLEEDSNNLITVKGDFYRSLEVPTAPSPIVQFQ